MLFSRRPILGNWLASLSIGIVKLGQVLAVFSLYLVLMKRVLSRSIGIGFISTCSFQELSGMWQRKQLILPT